MTMSSCGRLVILTKLRAKMIEGLPVGGMLKNDG
ncbi:hypothetical protein KS4_01350 [Poriferisphaera corsica]|uniref:Uncharacterized protein n=1 Tax=Poriferisphaera corsica TaxID=2528020 RepID=A0A517YPG5_9BACT|nr:hypothetical protein KS4_01350 [Poriferisphaera corsica]